MLVQNKCLHFVLKVLLHLREAMENSQARKLSIQENLQYSRSGNLDASYKIPQLLWGLDCNSILLLIAKDFY